MQLEIIHNESENCFETTVDSFVAKVIYTLSDNKVMDVTGTYVPNELGGKGIAAALTKYVLEYAREQKWKVKPICSYTVAYMKKNTEYGDLLLDTESE